MYLPLNANVSDNWKILKQAENGEEIRGPELHVYEYDDVDTFDDAVENKLIGGYDGWFGFKNNAKMVSYENFTAGTQLNINKPIMYMSGGDFVDMYPSRDLYSFIPKYNQYRKRIEKNWDYCITYPSSATSSSSLFGFFEEASNSIKAIYFDEYNRADNGLSQLVVYSMVKHGLTFGDQVNIYVGSEENPRIYDAIVTNIIDDYIFTISNGNIRISSQWISVEGLPNTVTSGGTTYTKSPNGLYYTSGSKKYYVINQTKINVDDNAQQISFKRTNGGIECEYYVRIFSKLPNFRFADVEITDYNLYENRKYSGLISQYQTHAREFESHVSKLAFANNIYSDGIGQVVFTDDIDIKALRDNRGRPLSSIYLTFIKANHGWREWYRNSNKASVTSSTVEYSHCFGPITCAFMHSHESRCNDSLNNARLIHNDCKNGYVISGNSMPWNSSYKKEIDYLNYSHFYGDLVCYDKYLASENHIDYIKHRFSTAQRENFGGDYFSKYVYDEIKSDDYDLAAFDAKSYIDDANDKKEGYYYQPHYEIAVRTYGKLESEYPRFIPFKTILQRRRRF